jgi:hypothetical protein
MKKVILLFLVFTLFCVFAPNLTLAQSNNGWFMPFSSVRFAYHWSWLGTGGEAIASGDFNNDGLDDVAYVYHHYAGNPIEGCQLWIYLQNPSTGIMEAPVNYPVEGYGSGNVANLAVGDINNDGRDDVVLGKYNDVVVFYQNTSGTLDSPLIIDTGGYVYDLKIEDVNNDNLPDVVTCGGSAWYSWVRVLAQNAGGTLDPAVAYSITNQFDTTLEIGDLNNDGLNDVVVMAGVLSDPGDPTIEILYQNAGGTLDSPVQLTVCSTCSYTSTDDIAIGDVNGDTYNDLVVVVTYGIEVFYQDSGGAGTLDPPVRIETNDLGDGSLVILDANRDGRQDLMFAHTWNFSWDSAASILLLQRNDGTLGDQEEYPIWNLSWEQNMMATGDFNNDGWVDVVYEYMYGILFHYGWDGSPALVLQYPSGNELLEMGWSLDISWGKIGTFTDVDIAYSIDGGASWRGIAAGVSAGGVLGGEYPWTVPYTPSDNCLVRITGNNLESTSTYPFTIVDDGVDRLIVTSPDGYETLVANTNHSITWDTTGAVDDVHIEYSTDNGNTWTDVVASTVNTGTYDWTVPDTPSIECRVRISDAADGTPTDTSDWPFTILTAGSETINVTAPNGGEVLTGGSTYNITWTHVGTFPNVRIQYSTDNGSSWANVIAATPNDGSHSWTVPNSPSNLCLVRISDALDGDPVDDSNNTFSIAAVGTPTLTVRSPNGGESFVSGMSQEIRWSSTGSLGSVHIEYSLDNGGSWTDVIASTANDGSHLWLVPSTLSTQCLIRISDPADGDPVDVSDGVFSIVNPVPTIAIISPNGGEYWQVGSTHDITWTSHGGVGNVKIEYSANNQATWSTIVSSTANDGSHSWTVPNSPSSTCFVRISEAADGNPSNTHYFPFSIVSGSPGPEIWVNREKLYFGSLKASTAQTPAQIILVENGNSMGTLKWQASFDVPWIKLDNKYGTQSGVINVSVEPMGLPVGLHEGIVSITSADAVNSPKEITVKLRIYAAGSDAAPFGSFETPVNGSTVSGSVPVTGWALDDIAVEKVCIYREAGSTLVYIGDAVLVDGARPDVEQSYPAYPQSYKAGWGYMMLTNFLPNGGNGTFTLHAIAKDGGGHQVDLGTKTITCDNANAVKPFGAIDTPAQGGIATGTTYRNQGWALTPMPNSIPKDGSTIKVFIDGVNIGNPNYNHYREDVANLFPGYANSTGSFAFLDFDTTQYSNGIHTIQWTATDSTGNTDGIGSRYFSIYNSGYSGQDISYGLRFNSVSQLEKIPQRNLNKGEKTQVEARETSRIELKLSNKTSKLVKGYLKIGSKLADLPAGSTIKKGNFYWLLGAGQNSNYDLVFLFRDHAGKLSQRQMRIKVIPKFSVER